MNTEDLIKRLESGIDPHEYRHEWGCSVLKMAADVIREKDQSERKAWRIVGEMERSKDRFSLEITRLQAIATEATDALARARSLDSTRPILMSW